jgi:heme-degrading monooxygenase HmoA
MILEIAQIDVKPGSEGAFETNIARAAEIFRAAAGCRSFAVRRSVEKPQRYRLLIEWDTLEAHTRDFTGSEPGRPTGPWSPTRSRARLRSSTPS